MHRAHRGVSYWAQAFPAAGWGFLCSLILAAPILAAHSRPRAASVVYFFFSFLCHQIPERSFVLLGSPLAVCHRCAGVYLGMFIGCFVGNHSMHRSARARRYWVFAAIAPVAFDLVAPVAGLWTNTACTRFSTGLLFGILISSLVVRGFEEFLQETHLRLMIDGFRLMIERLVQSRALKETSHE